MPSISRFLKKKGRQLKGFQLSVGRKVPGKKNKSSLFIPAASTNNGSLHSASNAAPANVLTSHEHTSQAERVEAIAIDEENDIPCSNTEPQSTKKNVAEILAELDESDFESIELRPNTKEYLKTLHGYLQCFTGLNKVYDKEDPEHELANHHIQDISLPLQQQSIDGEIVRSLNELYEVAEEVSPFFVAKVEEWVNEVRNDLMCRFDEIAFKLPDDDNKLKKMSRASEKARDDYSKKKPGPPVSWLYDIVRGSVLFGSASQLLYFLQLLRSDASIEIVKSKNRFQNPTLSGYRDWNLHIRISTDDGIQHICELQLHHRVINEADVAFGSHTYYEFFRKYYAGFTGTLEQRIDDLRTISNGSSLNLAFLKEVIKNPVEKEGMLRLADLFHHHVNDYQLAMIITNAARCSDDEPVDVYKRLGLLFSKQGNQSAAMTMYERHLERMLETFGSDHLDTAGAYNSIAMILLDLGNLDEAMKMHQLALEIQQKVVETDHELIASTYNHIANILWNQGKLDDAMAKYKQVLDSRLKTLGNNHLDTAQSYNNMANILDDQGKYEQAMEMYQKNLKITLRALGHDHPNTASSYSNMAGVLRRQGKFDEAMGIHNRALQIRLQCQGEDHPDTAATYNNIANVLYDQGRHNEATETYLRALDIRLRRLGHDHPDTAQTYNNLASVLNVQGKKEEALVMYQKYLKIALKTIGKDHPDTALAYSSMALILGKQGKRYEAMQMYRQVLQIQLKNEGMNDPETATTCTKLAKILEEQGSREEARVCYQQALEIQLATLGSDHQLTAETYCNIAVVFNFQGEQEQALKMHQQALDIRLKVLGQYHRDTAQSYSYIADVYDDLGRYDEAMQMYEKAVEIKRKSRSGGSSSVGSNSVRDIKIVSS